MKLIHLFVLLVDFFFITFVFINTAAAAIACSMIKAVDLHRWRAKYYYCGINYTGQQNMPLLLFFL